MVDVAFTVDGKTLTAPAGSLLIDACRKAGIEIPAFCYYPGLSLQAACRMCVVRQEKVPKLQTACTTTVAEGQVFITDSPEIAQARKATIELLLGNHPLDCPVCDAGGECELQDMTFKYGAGESLYAEAKHHRDEQQWSPAVFYDRPRCILCYRCIRMCGEGMDVWALGIHNRGADSVIVPNDNHQLDCEQCGMCIDVCPVGALTSGSYRYKTRPWEMNHVSTVCTHCSDGCKVTLGVRQTNDGSEIVRADNRDKSGINGDFLCAKGRFGFDFVDSPDRLKQPLVRNPQGKLEPATWEQAIRFAAGKLKEIRDSRGGKAIGVIGSNRTTNEENYLLQKFARTVLETNNIDHPRTADYAAFARALAGHTGKTASLRDIASAPAILVAGGNPTEEHPLLAWLLRTNVRLNRARLYIANSTAIKLDRQAKAVQHLPADGYRDSPASSATANPTSARLSSPKNRSSFSSARSFAARPSKISSPGALSAKTFVLPFLATTPTPAALPIWACCPTCCLATFPLIRPAPLPSIPTSPLLPAKPCRKCFKPPPRASSALCWSSAPIPFPDSRSIQPHSRTPSSSSRISSSPRPQPWPTWFSRLPASTRNQAPSPIPLAIFNWFVKPPTAPA